MKRTEYLVDRTIRLAVEGSTQTLRLCARAQDLPPLLIVQGGPGLPMLSEAARLQRLLNLEERFLVVYWDQRGCGPAPGQEAQSVSLARQLADLQFILRWLKETTGRAAVLLGVSLGATLALQAAAGERGCVRTVIAVSPDTNTAISDRAVADFLEAQSLLPGNSSLSHSVKKLGSPPYITPARFQHRLRLLADLGKIENHKNFRGMLAETLLGLLKTYGLFGLVRSLANMGRVQSMLLPELPVLNLRDHPLRLQVPVHFIFGQEDPLVPEELIKRLPEAVTAPAGTLTRIPGAGHMAHFDQPEIVRTIIAAAGKDL